MLPALQVELPSYVNADWTALTWGDRNALDARRSVVNAGAWLDAFGEQIVGVYLPEVSGGLTVWPVELLRVDSVIKGWAVRVSGGVPGTSGAVRFRIALAQQGLLVVEVGITTRPNSGRVYTPIAPSGTIIDDFGRLLADSDGRVLDLGDGTVPLPPAGAITDDFGNALADDTGRILTLGS